MAIELIKEAFKVEELKGRSEMQALVETEFYLSPTKPNIEKILWAQGKVDILSTKIIKDKLIINGLTKFNILYRALDETNSFQTIDATKEFREELDILGIDEDMVAKIKSKIEYIEYELEESKLSLRALVNLWGEVAEFRTIEAIKEIKGNDSLQYLKEEVNYKEVHGREISYAIIKEMLKLDEDHSEIDEIVKFSINTKEVETMVVEDRVITSGELMVNLLYSGGDKIYSHKETIPFNHFVEMPGVENGLKGSVEFEVIDGIYEVMLNDLSERKLVDLEIKLRVTAKAFEDKTRELIIDAYSTEDIILLEREEITIKESVKDIQHKERISSTINDFDPGEILEITSDVNLLSAKYEGEVIVLDGVISLNVEYQERITGELASYKEDIPFRSSLYESEFMDVSMGINTSIDDIDYSIKKDGLVVDCEVLLDINLSKNRKIYSIKGIEETGESIDKTKKPSIIVYIVQRGDKLWDIAKRYNTTREEILLSNNNSSGEIKPGDKIIIEKKVYDLTQ